MSRRGAGLGPGTSIDGLTIEAVLGEGGFGAVYRAVRIDGVPRALKVSNVPARRLPAQQLAWQQNEVEALTRLRHPSLVQVERFGVTDDGRFYLAMELVEGTRLDEYVLERGRLDCAEALQFARRIADALAHCHAHDVLHLDLKPHNIIITDPAAPEIKILDFGLAQLRQAAGLEAAPQGAGTLGYTPPERFVDRAGAAPSPRQDLYSLGAILFEMLTGRHVFDARAAEELIAQQAAQEAPSVLVHVPSVPAPVAELVASLLARDPARRIASAALLCARLKQLYFATLRGSDAAAPVPIGLRSHEDTAFIGRTDELAIVRAEAEQVARGSGRAVMLVGEPGIGKSRLLSQALRTGVLRDAMVMHGRCRHIGELLPYAPLREVLGQLAAALQHMSAAARSRARERLADVLAADAEVLPALAPELDELCPPATSLDEGRDLSLHRLAGAERVARAIGRALAAVCADALLVVALEDVHWADEGTLAVLRQLLDEPPPGVLLLLTSRVTDRLPAGRALRVLDVNRLAPEHNDELLLALTGGGDAQLAASLKRAIPLLAAGNPLFNTQVVRDLEMTGLLRRDDAGLPLMDIGALRADYAPPDSVSRVLERVVWRIGPAQLEILGTAAIMGRHFLISDLCALELFEEADVRAAVAEAEELCLVRTAGDSCHFVHDTIREHIEGTVPALHLRVIHAAVAGQLIRRGAAPAARGRHLEQAGDARGAARAYVEAGLEADRLHDPHGARRHLGRAFDILIGLPADERDAGELVRVTHELVRVGCVFGNTGDTLGIIDRCAAALPDRTSKESAALHSAYARLYYVQGQGPRAMEHSRAALATLGSDPRMRPYQVLPLNVVGRALCVTGRFGPAMRMLRQGCDLADEAGEHAERAHSEGLLAVALGFTGAFDEAAARSESSTRLSELLGDPVRIIGCHVYNAAVAESRFDWEAGIHETTQLLSLAEEHAIAGLYLYVGTAMAGRHQFHIGHLDRARVLLGNALAMSRSLEIVMLLSWTQAFLGDVYLVAGRLEDARRHYEAGLEAATARNGDEYAAPLCLVGLAHLSALNGGTPEEIRPLADEALARLAAVDNVSARVTALQRYAEALEIAGAAEESRALMGAREELVASLGLDGDIDFWPRLPEPLAAPPAVPRVYWRDRPTPRHRPGGARQVAFGTTEVAVVPETTGRGDEAETVDAGGKAADSGGAAARDDEPAPGSLLDGLSTIEGFVPRFWPRSHRGS
jgi:tetratricopeptide (TPR) repeat protein